MTASFGPLVDVHWLAEHLDHSPLRVADCRWYLADPDGGETAYGEGHIPNAIRVSIDEHLTAPEGPGRHPLPGPDEIARTLGNLGIGDRNFVVAYDDAGGGIAARLWWMLRSIGHTRVGVLNGGIQAWVESGGALTTEVPRWDATKLTIGEPYPTIDRETLAAGLGSLTVIDARAGDRYRGETEPIDPVAGHIPTAINLPHGGNLDDRGRFLPAGTLQSHFESAGVTSGSDTVAYCGSGVTACHDILAMEVAGLGTATLYPGSWSDWSSSGGEVATGHEPGSPQT